MQSGKVVGPDDIPVVIWRWLGERAKDLLTRLFSTILDGERSPGTDHRIKMCIVVVTTERQS